MSLFSRKTRGNRVSSSDTNFSFAQIDGGFFVFGDLSIKVEGTYRLEFTLFEMQKKNVIAKELRTKKYKIRIVKAKKGKGSFKRKKNKIFKFYFFLS